MESINHLAVASSAILILVVGAIWYSPLMFFKAWQNQLGFTEETPQKHGMGKVYILTLLIALLMCYNLAFFLADPTTDYMWGMTAGFLTGFWAAGIFIVVALFEQKSWKYMFIDGGFIVVYFTLAGLILGAWR